jgi:RNA-directed DNA polymerase
VSKRTFSYLDLFAWRRVTRWLRKRHPRLNWTAIRRRYLHGWQIADGGIELFMPSTVAVTRYRYRGTKIPTPWTPSTEPAAQLVESRMQ